MDMEWSKTDREPEVNDRLAIMKNTSTGNREANKSTSEPQDPHTGDDQPKKNTKRRAARACLSCRARKVRCDVVQSTPCFNCRMDGYECVSVKHRRKKLPQTQRTLGGTYSVDATFIDNSQQFFTQGQTRQQDQVSQHSYDLSLGSGTTQVAGDSQITSWSLDLSEPTDFLKPGSTNPSLIPTEGKRRLSGSSLPAFLNALSPEMDPVDAQYLQAKGALSLPSIPLQNALLGAYLEYVHPYLPLLDVHDFLAVLSSRDGSSGQVSLLLYQAVMFAATAFVDMKHLFTEGFATRKAARNAFYRKTRLLYDCDYETNRFTLVQALLLMTYWFETAEELKDTWHWTGIAVSVAHSINLHRNPAKTNLSDGSKRLRKRVWWSCYMRDRLVSLSTRRLTRINDDDFDVPMLNEEDFDLVRLADTSLMMPSSCALILNMDLQKELVAMCIAKSQLCIAIGRVLRTQYSVPQEERRVITTHPTLRLITSFEEVERIDRNLTKWLERLPASCKYTKSTASEVEKGRSTVVLQRTLLHMVYHTTVYALYRPHCSLPCRVRTPEVPMTVQDKSRLKVCGSASTITLLASELHHLRLDMFLPTTGATVIIAAMATHLLEMKSPLPEVQESAIQGYRRCSRVMNELRQTYAAAEYASTLMDTTFQEVMIGLAARSASSPSPSSTDSTSRSLGPAIPSPPPDNAPYMTPAETMFSTAETCGDAVAQMPSALSWLKALESMHALPELGGPAPSPQLTDFGSIWDKVSPGEYGIMEDTLGKDSVKDTVDLMRDSDQSNELGPLQMDDMDDAQWLHLADMHLRETS